MFDKNALSQLNQLKKDIVDSKDVAKATVRGSNGKFGFAALEDGRDAFITPDDMNRVFPGDRIRVNVVAGKGGKPQAELEKFYDSALTDMVGQYHIRGQGHFIQPDVPQLNRWLFIPPSQRKGLAPGDYIHCKISQHPFYKQGKAQVKVLENLGNLDQAGIEARYMMNKFSLDQGHNPSCESQAKDLEEAEIVADEQWQDKTELEFFTIDSAKTLDMDDALHIASSDSGWQLQVAIACPAAELEHDSAIAKSAQAKAQTVYLAGNIQQMIPPSLSQHRYSLLAGAARRALVCNIKVGESGSLDKFEFSTALISSKHKLNYPQVAQHFDSNGDSSIGAELAEQLKQLRLMSEARLRYRREHHLIMEDRPDFEIHLNDAGKIDNISKHVKTPAHQLVEESMLATNICAAQYLKQNKLPGLYSLHQGFREDKLKVIAEVIEQDFAELQTLDLQDLADYRQFISHLQQQQSDFLPACKRLLQSAELSLEAGPHFGLGLEAYATITSPIRRYQDQLNQRAILSTLISRKTGKFGHQDAEALQEKIQAGRQAVRQMEQWLHCQYMQNMIGQTFTANIGLVNGQGIGVRLDDNGIEGFVMMQGKSQSCELDHRRLQLKCGENTFKLEQAVKVTVRSIDLAQRRIALELAE